MKKIYAFLAAAFMSASLFAAPTTAPTAADLSAYGDLGTDVVLALYFDEQVCNDVVLVGTYNGWATDDVAALIHFEPVAGFNGWYVASFTWEQWVDDQGALKDPQAKAVQLKKDGSFEWDYQTGDKDAWINQGGKDATIEAGYSGECNVSYSEAGAYIYEIAYFKNHNTPCVDVPTHKYTLVLFDPYCEENPEFIPAVAGAHNGWAISPMSEGTYEGELAWIMVIESEEGKEYKFLEATRGWSNEFQWYDEENDSWNNFENSKFPVAEGDVTLVFDYSNTDLYRYPKCGTSACADEEIELSIFLKAPAGAPAAGVEIMGGFNEWSEGVAMTWNPSTDYFEATLSANPNKEFKFREAGTWDNEIVTLDGESLPNFTFCGLFDESNVITLDLSDPSIYTWKSHLQGIENVTLTEKAQKVVVDGVLYIVRDNKMFNVQGTQVR